MAKDPRLNVTFPQALFDMTLRDSRLSNRSHSNQIVECVEKYYQELKKQAEVFTPSELGEEARPKAPVFRMKDEPDESDLPKTQERHSREKS